jgi:hypothetical protein
MKLSERYEKLMDFIYKEYERSNSFHGHGVYASVIVRQFQRYSGISFGDAGAQLSAINHIFMQGWIEIVTVNGSVLKGEELDGYSRIQPTREGMLHVEERRSLGKVVMKAASTTAEIIGRGLKGFLGR